jgi:hypothetical protein
VNSSILSTRRLAGLLSAAEVKNDDGLYSTKEHGQSQRVRLTKYGVFKQNKEGRHAGNRCSSE